jgi:PPOX class probable F420-dependent enzyme
MDIDKAKDFVRTHHRAILATRRSDGAPQLSPVAATVDGSGRVVISSRETAIKTRNVRRDPSVSLLVISDGFFGEWVQLDGTSEVVSLPEAMDPLIEYYRSVAGEHENWDEYRAAMQAERRVVLAVSVTRAGPDKAG